MFEDLKKITKLSSIKDKDIFYEASFNYENILKLFQVLKNNELLSFDQLIDITAIDYPSREKRFELVYILLSMAPILLTAFGAILLNEKVRWRRWSAVLLGFIGVVVVINPGKLESSYYFIFPIIAAIMLSIRDMYTKKFKKDYPSLQIAFMTCFVVTLLFGLLSIYKFYDFSLKDIFILFIAAFFLALGYIFSIATIKIALVSITSTFRYSVILWGILYGYFLFDEVPSANSYIGALIIIVSGLIIISRQKKTGVIK